MLPVSSGPLPLDSVREAGTHDGSFHADDVLGGAILRSIVPGLAIHRTRDTARLNSLPLIFDVGRVHDSASGQFDHHQKGGAGLRPNGIPFASAGLLWSAYGLESVRQLAKTFDVPFVDLAARVDAKLVQTIDADDCGVSTGGGFSFAHALKALNPPAGPSPHATNRAARDRAYEDAVGLALSFLRAVTLQEASAIWARNEVQSCYTGGPILVLPCELPWEGAVIEELPDVRFVIVPKGDQVNIETVPLVLGGFEQRFSLPKAWAGLSDAALQDATGIEDAVFCHNGRFVAAARSVNGARRMAALACEQAPLT